MNIFKKLKMYVDSKRMKKFSTTLTSSKEGTSYNPIVKEYIDILSKDNISNEELNKVVTSYFNLKPIPSGVYIFNKDFLNSMVLDIDKIQTIHNENEIVDVRLAMSDITYNMNINISVSVKNFHEVFKILNIKEMQE